MRCCLKSLLNFVLILALLGAIAAAVLYLWAFPTLDTRLADSVRHKFMLPPSSTVKMTRGNLLDTLQGRVPQMLVEADEAKIEGLKVEQLRLVATDAVFDLPATLTTGNAQFKDIASSQLELRVSEDALKERWSDELESRGLQKVEITLRNGLVHIGGVFDAALFKLRIGTSGALKVDGTDRIIFDPSNIELGGANIGLSEAKALFSALTPVLDLGPLKLGVGVDKLEPRNGYLYVKAKSLKLDELTRKLEDKGKADDSTPEERTKATEEGDKRAKELNKFGQNGEPGAETGK